MSTAINELLAAESASASISPVVGSSVQYTSCSVDRGKQHADITVVDVNTSSEDEKARSLSSPESGTVQRQSEFGPNFEKARRWKRHIQYSCLCWNFILVGWNDGSTGPLLPRIQDTYHVNFAVVSLLFVFLCIGFLCGAVLNVYLTDRFGFGKVIVFGSIAQIFAYAMEIPGPPFPVWVSAFCLYGFGSALQQAQVNAFVVGFNDHSKMSILHACYGFGALVSPFVATRFSEMKHWSFHYFTAFGLATTTCLLLLVIFRMKTQEELYAETGYPPSASNINSLTEGQSKYRQMWSLKVVHLLAFFVFAYCGCEVTIGGWAVTYIIHRTGGGPSSGYVSSGFFGGLMLGRLLLIWVNKKIGERRAIFVYSAIAIGLEIFIWLYPRLIPSAIAISFVGFLLGPMFPIMLNQCACFVPSSLLVGSIGWITSFGLLGTAVMPLMTGALAEKFGIVSLQPLLVGMMSFMVGLWALVLWNHRRGSFSQTTSPAISRTETEILK